MVDRLEVLENSLREMAISQGASEFIPIEPRNIVTAHWVRMKCQFGCPNYGTRLSCPPFSPTLEETRKILGEYTRAYLIGYDGFLYFREHPDKDTSTSWPELGFHVRRSMLELERQAFLSGYYKALAYGFGGCHRCDTCVIMEGNCTCRFPAEFRSSMESIGIDVYGTIRSAGLELAVISGNKITKTGQMVLHVLLLLD